MSDRRRVALGVFLAGGGLFVFLLPFTLMLLPNPSAVRVSSVEAAGPGVYAGSPGQVFRLFPFAAPVPAFPHGVPSVTPDARLHVRTKSTEDFTSCRLSRFPSGAAVALRTTPPTGRSATLAPVRALAEGRYVLSAPRGGMYGGTDYYYFRVEPSDAKAR